MDGGGVTWIVTADGARARVFEERVRAGELRELPGRRMQAEDADRPQALGHRGTVHESAGPGRHGAGERDPAGETERRFLRRVAAELEAAAGRTAFDRLVLMAPPRALGALKGELAPAVAARLEGADHHDCVAEDAEAIRRRLRDVRGRA